MGILNIIIDKDLKDKDKKHITPKIGDNNAKKFCKSEDFLNFIDKYDEEKCKNLFKNFLTYINQFIDLSDKNERYSNSLSNLEKNKNYRQIISEYKNFKKNNLYHPGLCKSIDEKNSFSASLKINKNEKQIYFYTNPENVLERLIKLSSDTKNIDIENQIPIPDIGTTSHIDLIKKKSGYIELIELKQWKNDKNTPFWAIAESIKNLYMYIHFGEKLKAEERYFSAFFLQNDYENMLYNYDFSKIQNCKLTILAPVEYYEQHFCYDKIYFDKKRFNNYQKYCKIIELLVKEDLNNNNIDINISISTEFFRFSRERYNSLIGKNIDDLSDTIIGDYIKNEKIKIDTSDEENLKLIPLQDKEKMGKTKSFNLKDILHNKDKNIRMNIITKNDIELLTAHKNISELFQ